MNNPQTSIVNTPNTVLWPSFPVGSSMLGMDTSSSIVKIAGALVRAQKKMGMAVKDSKNPFYKSSYADLNSIREATMPALSDEGIAVLQPTVVVNGKQYIRTLLLHESGEYLSADTEVVTAKQNDPQAHGSAISYARRYGLQAMLNVGSVDDDGESAMGRTTKSAAPGPEPKTSSFRKPKAPETPVAPTSTEEGWQ